MERGRGGEGTLASNHCESQILRSPVNGASDWFKIGQMIETRLLLVIDYFKMANDEEDLQRALDFLAQKGFDRELKEEQKSAILQLMRGGDLLGVLPTGFGKSLIFQLLAVANKGLIVVIKGEAIRLLRTNSSKTTFEECLANFTRRLEARGYPKKYIKVSCQR